MDDYLTSKKKDEKTIVTIVHEVIILIRKMAVSYYHKDFLLNSYEVETSMLKEHDLPTKWKLLSLCDLLGLLAKVKIKIIMRDIWKDKYETNHGIRFAMKRSTEQRSDFEGVVCEHRTCKA